MSLLTRRFAKMRLQANKENLIAEEKIEKIAE